MDSLDTREWLLTNGTGSFASGTISDAHTRTYHGWLIAALEPPGQRTLLLSHLDASLEIAGQIFELGVNFWNSGIISPQGHLLLQGFQIDPVPTWTWGLSHWHLVRRLVMPDAHQQHPSTHRLLVQYSYYGSETATLKLRPLIADRIFHDQQRAADPRLIDIQYSQIPAATTVRFQAKRLGKSGTPWQLSWSHGDYYPDGIWYWGYRYPEETRRGLADTEDLYSPGCLVTVLAPGETVTLEVTVPPSSRLPALDPATLDPATLDPASFDQAVAAEQQRLAQLGRRSRRGANPQNLNQTPEWQPDRRRQLASRLLAAGDQFVAYRASIQGPTVIAGYPWFNDWGRDTLIALPGLALIPKRFDLARGLLKTFGQHCHQGLIPNSFPDAGVKPFYNSVDAALWWIETLGLYLEASQDWNFLVEQYPVVWSIYKGLMTGTLYSIRVDAFDGLVTWNAAEVALTWMDAVVAEQPVTPRRGKPIEISALWYSALCWAEAWAIRLQQAQIPDYPIDNATLSNQARRFATQAEQVKASLQKFWNPAAAYLYDTIDPDDYPDPTIRPNAVIALSLRHCGFPEAIGQSVLQLARQRLLTPYGLRSLDPADPQYIGHYQGGIWQRDRAYHQGTVWPWLLGPFIRAWQRFYPSEPIPFDWQPLLEHFHHQACLGSISEMFDGDPPHSPKGAVAQAWSVAELIRYWVGNS